MMIIILSVEMDVQLLVNKNQVGLAQDLDLIHVQYYQFVGTQLLKLLLSNVMTGI